MTGSLVIAGLGPGAEGMVTPEVSEALDRATDVIGSVIVAAGILMVQLSRVPATAGPAQAAGDDIRSIHSASSAAARRTESRS